MDLSNLVFYIQFPPEIFEEINKISQNDFIVENLEGIYDEAWKWVKDKLDKIFTEFKKKTSDKISRIIFFNDYFDLYEETNLERQPSDIYSSSNLNENFISEIENLN